MKRTLLGLAAMALFFTACKKDDDAPATYYLSKLIQVGEDGNDTTLVSWNADNTFKETYSAAMNNGELQFYAEGPVYEGGKIVAIQQRSTFNPNTHNSKTFVYTGTQVTRVNYYFDNDQDGQYTLAPVFDSLVYTAGKLSEFWALNPDMPDNQTKYILTWEGNNVKTCSLYFKIPGSDFMLQSVTKYTYDTKPGLQHVLGGFQWLSNLTSFDLLSANNLLKEEEYRGDVLSFSSINTYTYEGNLLKMVDTEDKYTDPVSTETYKLKFEYITK